MKKILRALIVVVILSIITVSVALGTEAERADVLSKLGEIERDVYIGKSGSIGMEGAASPSMLYVLQDGNEKNDNSLNGSSNTLIKDLEGLEELFRALDPDEDYAALESESQTETDGLFSFTVRLEILSEKLNDVLDEFEDSGINNEKQLDKIRYRIELCLKITTKLSHVTNPVCADFSQLSEGASVEGVGIVAPFLDIATPTGGAVKIFDGGTVDAYGTPNKGCYLPPIPTIVHNGWIADGGGFTDIDSVGVLDDETKPSSPHNYTFTFNDEITISRFSLRMLDFGDWNPDLAIYHRVEMIAYNPLNALVSTQILEYSTEADGTPNSSSSPDYGDIQCNNGDASAESGFPGNWTWNVSGVGINRVTLTFPNGHDPYFGLDTLCFVVEP